MAIFLASLLSEHTPNRHIMKIGLSISLLIALAERLLVSGQTSEILTLDLIFNQRLFVPASIEDIRPMADGNHFSFAKDEASILSSDYETGKTKRTLFSVEKLADAPFQSFSDYFFDSDEKMILLETDKKPIYRHSFDAVYYLADLRAGSVERLEPEGRQQLAAFSPDGKLVAFVRSNNLYYKDLERKAIIQVTFDGKINSIINGAPDWAYEEEFALKSGYCWSPDSRYLAYYRFDESDVSEFSMTRFEGLYPEVQRFKYPKAGEENARVTIRVYDTQTGKSNEVITGQPPDGYVPRIKWTTRAGQLCLVLLNRQQNEVCLVLADAATGNSTLIYKEQNSRYISEIGDRYIEFSSDGQFFIIQSERDGYYHYYRHRMDGTPVNAATKGNWDVVELLDFDPETNMLYYSSTEISAIDRHVFAIRADGTGKTLLTERCGDNHAAFSKGKQWFIHTWSDANHPPVYSVCDKKGKQIRLLEDNAGVNSAISRYGFVKKEFIRIPSAGNDLNAFLLKPACFDSSARYPMVVIVYGGPESQDVLNKWDRDLAWQQYLASQGIVVMQADGRGTDGRGEEFRKCIYMQLGKNETDDQVAAARHMGSFSWIDTSRIGIWGWSYGGFMALMCLTDPGRTFKLGIAVAPVTDWRFYDTIYTERFMRKPDENPAGYSLSPLNRSAMLHGKLLLVHGTADDNVHFQNSMAMADSLIKAGKQFNFFAYPERNHNIAGGNTRLHLYSMFSEFIRVNL